MSTEPASNSHNGKPASGDALSQEGFVSEEDIQVRARQMWERAGRPHGKDGQLWREAQEELRDNGRAAKKPSPTLSPEEWAELLVTVSAEQPGLPWSVKLDGLLPEPLLLCTHRNPAVVEENATRIKAYLAALIRESRQGN